LHKDRSNRGGKTNGIPLAAPSFEVHACGKVSWRSWSYSPRAWKGKIGMKRILVPVLSTGLVAWMALTASAQQGPEGQPKEGEPKEKQTPESLPLLPGPGCNPPCPAVKIIVVEQAHPIQILAPREVITTVKKKTLAVEYRDVKRVFTDYELQPKEVYREVPCTTMVPCEEVDPHTGKVCTIMKPVTEMKLEKQTVFVSVPIQRELIEKVPYLKQVDEDIPQVNVLLEWRTHLQPTIGVVPGPGWVYPNQYYITPHHHHDHGCPGCKPGH
jgi:hypothetical protein